MSEDDLLYEVTDEIGLITFNRPRSRNALTFAMYERLSDICANAPTDGSVKVIIVTGAGDKAFAAGTDIAQFRDFGTAEQGIDYERNAERTFSSIDQCPVPTIAAIGGTDGRDFLIRLLPVVEPWVKTGILNDLAPIGDGPSIKAIRDCLADPEPRVREMAQHLLPD